MNRPHRLLILTAPILLIFSFCVEHASQTPALKRTTFKTQTVESGPGATIAVSGSPAGSIRVEGWNRNEVEISAEIEVSANNEEDLARLAKVTGFAVDEGLTKISIVSVGPHDKKYLKKADKEFPKRLRNSPFRIDYVVRVPMYSDLLIDGGKGNLELSGVEGSMIINYLESNARLILTGGSVQATIGKGDVEVIVARPSWRGRFAQIQVASGRLDLRLPRDMNANLEAAVLRTGQIENGFSELKPMRRTTFSDTAMNAVAGSGGARLSFTVGDGILAISYADPPRIAVN